MPENASTPSAPPSPSSNRASASPSTARTAPPTRSLIARYLSAHQGEVPLLAVICANAVDAQRLSQEIGFFAPDARVRLLPDWETLPYDTFSPHQDLVSERLATLHDLGEGRCDILLVPATTALYRMAPAAFLAAYTFAFTQGERLDEAKLKAQLTLAGYEHVSQVVRPGEYCVRGALIDLFPMGSPLPYRIDLFDDEVDSIRAFDPDTQRSLYPVRDVRLLPGREFPFDEAARTAFRSRWRETFEGDPSRAPIYKDIGNGVPSAGIEYYLPLFFEDTATLFDYLPPDAHLVFTGDLDRPRSAASRPIRSSATTSSRTTASGRSSSRSACSCPTRTSSRSPSPSRAWCCRPRRRAAGPPRCRRWRWNARLRIRSPRCAPTSRARPTACCSRSNRRAAARPSLQLLAEHGLRPVGNDSYASWLASDERFALGVAPLDERLRGARRGLRGRHRDRAVRRHRPPRGPAPPGAGQQRRRDGARPLRAARSAIRWCTRSTASAATWASCRWTSAKARPNSCTSNTRTRASSTCRSRNLHVISRYSGADPDSAPLHPLGSGQWERAKRKAAEQVRDTAAELLDLYARRAAREGHAFALEPRDYVKFAESFGFEETPDQAAAIAAVIGDMTSGKPMDRLVCGDVGFGKTEVALRAAFVAVHGRQAGGGAGAHHAARRAALRRPSATASPTGRCGSPSCRASSRPRR